MSRRAFSSSPHRARSAFRQVLPRLLLGIGLAAAGLLFTLDNVDLIDAEEWFRWWPALVVAFGVGLIATGTTAAQHIGGIVWTAIGAWLLLDNLGLVRFDPWDLWPLGLVAGGVALVLRALAPHRRAAAAAAAPPAPGAGATDLGPAGGRPADPTIHGFAMMSGVAIKNTSIGFQGGTLNAIMGAVEVDLRGATLAGGSATIDCFAMWGGIEITVPPGWTVVGQVWPLMGGFEDKTSPPAPEDATGELVLTGWAVMGGVAVKN
jgi:hypothetical protein